jgi:hypothetical protein
VKQLVYSIYDKVAKESGPLFFAKNEEVAQRQFNNVLGDFDEVRKSEYELILIGTFETETCEMELV